MDCGREAASGAAQTTISPPFGRRTLLVNANDRAVDYLYIAFRGLNNSLHEANPAPCLSPSVEAIVDRDRQAEALGEIRPENSCAQHAEDAVEHTPIIDARLAERIFGKQRQDHILFEVAEFISSHIKLPSGSLNHDQPVLGIPFCAFIGLRTTTCLRFKKKSRC